VFPQQLTASTTCQLCNSSTHLDICQNHICFTEVAQQDIRFTEAVMFVLGAAYKSVNLLI